VCEYVGEVLSDEELKNRRLLNNFNVKNYVLTIKEWSPTKQAFVRTHIDSSLRGNFARFINHSCDPNLAVHAVRVDLMIPCAVLFAIRDINVDEELTFHYGSQNISPRENITLVQCKCGSSNCAGFLPYDSLS